MDDIQTPPSGGSLPLIPGTEEHTRQMTQRKRNNIIYDIRETVNNTLDEIKNYDYVDTIVNDICQSLTIEQLINPFVVQQITTVLKDHEETIRQTKMGLQCIGLPCSG